MQSTDELVERLAQLEGVRDIPAALDLLNTAGLNPEGAVATTFGLYQRRLSILPFVIAEKLLSAGLDNAIIRTLFTHLAIRLGHTEVAAESLPRLEQMLADAGEADRHVIRTLLDPGLPLDALNYARSGNHAVMRALTQLWALGVPDTTRRFAQPPADHQPDVARFKHPIDAARLRCLAVPPVGTPRVARKAVIGFRHSWFPQRANSREHDVPSRIAAGFEGYGWRAFRHDLHGFHDDDKLIADYQALAALCRAQDADVLVIDDFMPSRARVATGEIIRALRQERPDLHIVSAYFDPWQPSEWDDMEAAAGYIDCAWTNSATPVWQRPALAPKTLFMTIPHGGLYPLAPRIAPGFRFGAGISYSNWDRAFWLGALAETDLLTKTIISTHQTDNLNALESYRAYMTRQADCAEAGINLARRSSGIPTITGRTFETLATGNLLVQERSDDIDAFFVAGRHYLRFETITDLHDIAYLIRTEPDYVDAVRLEGAAFFREHYSDERLVAYLDCFLFHNPAVARQAA